MKLTLIVLQNIYFQHHHRRENKLITIEQVNALDRCNLLEAIDNFTENMSVKEKTIIGQHSIAINPLIIGQSEDKAILKNRENLQENALHFSLRFYLINRLARVFKYINTNKSRKYPLFNKYIKTSENEKEYSIGTISFKNPTIINILLESKNLENMEHLWKLCKMLKTFKKINDFQFIKEAIQLVTLLISAIHFKSESSFVEWTAQEFKDSSTIESLLNILDSYI